MAWDVHGRGGRFMRRRGSPTPDSLCTSAPLHLCEDCHPRTRRRNGASTAVNEPQQARCSGTEAGAVVLSPCLSSLSFAEPSEQPESRASAASGQPPQLASSRPSAAIGTDSRQLFTSTLSSSARVHRPKEPKTNQAPDPLLRIALLIR